MRIDKIMVFCISFLLMLSGAATAADRNWTGGGTDNLWTTSANWDTAPAAGDYLYISVNGDPLINMAVSPEYNRAYVGAAGSPKLALDVEAGGSVHFSDRIVLGNASGHGGADLNVSDGSVTVDNWFGIGLASGGASALNLSGTGTVTAVNLSVALAGAGTLNMTGGTLILGESSSRLRIGEGGGGGIGTVNMDGGTMRVGTDISIGYTAGEGTDAMTMSAGDVTAYSLIAGHNGNGTFDMSGGNLFLNSHVNVGAAAGLGVWSMSGGLVKATNYVCVGRGTSAGETDLLEMTAGEILTGDLWIGGYGDGIVNLSGGGITVNGFGNGSYTNGLVFDTNGGDGLLNITGGTLTWLGGNFTNEVNALATSGDIIAYSGGGALNVGYNSVSNATIVTATAPDDMWTGGGADNLWTTSGNWSTVPDAGDNVFIDTAVNSPLINMDVVDTYSRVYVGVDSTSEVALTVQSNGFLRSSVALCVAENAGSQARLDMEGGDISGYDMFVGDSGAAVVNVTGGTMEFSRNVILGNSEGHGTTELNISGGVVNVGSWVGAGRKSGGMNTINVTDSGYLETGNMSVGLSGNGMLNISGNGHVKLDAAGSRLRVGETANGATDTINMNGGTLEVQDYIGLGYAADTDGSLNMTAGTISATRLVVGWDGSGVFEMSGGHLVVVNHVLLGQVGGEGVWQMQGGLVEATNYVAIGQGATDVGETNILNMSGGEIQADILRIGVNGAGIVNLSGGVIAVNYYGDEASTSSLVFDSGTGDGLLNLSGGTLIWMNGDYTEEVNAFVLSGDIVADDGAGTVSAVYDSGLNRTLIQANLESFEQWVAVHNLSGTDAESAADPDGDGFNNLYEYGLGGNPTNAADQGVSPEFDAVTIEGADSFRYIYPQVAGSDDELSYFLEINTDLMSGTWTNFGYEITGTNITGGALDFVTNVITVNKNSKFIRLIIEEL